MKRKVFLAIFIAILVMVVLLVMSYVLYFSDFISASSKGVPSEAYNKYFFTKLLSTGDSEARYSLYACELENRTRVFGVVSGHVFFDVNEIYFDSNGNQLCENHYVIDCRDNCPKCLNANLSNCEIVLSNY